MAGPAGGPTRTKWLWIAVIVVLILLAIYIFANPSGDADEIAAGDAALTEEPALTPVEPTQSGDVDVELPQTPVQPAAPEQTAPTE